MRRQLAVLSTLAIPLLWIFRQALFGGQSLAFRDAAFYYFPYYRYVLRRWSDGFPIWNPLDGLGQPLLADPTAAVLYPAKLLFCLPLPYSVCFSIYVVSHLLLAGWGAYQLARKLRTTHLGAVLAGLCYELSGQVLFQYCNPIYLVGAAWLPVALGYSWDLLQRTDAKKTPWMVVSKLAVVLSMMILGGDPQMVVHALLCVGIWFALSFFSSRKNMSWRRQFRSCVFFLLACFGAALLSAVQILPSQEWAARSDRSLTDRPRSLSQVAALWFETGELQTDGLWSQSDNPTEHERKVYQFSVGPWRWPELFWPNVTGKFGPRNTRWIRGLPGEGRMWAASLYLGLLPAILALTRIRLFRGANSIRWITWVTVISLLAAMGEYGLGWLLDEAMFLAGSDDSSALVRGLGNVYWFLTVVVPGYAQFRYPAKWWTITALGISLLAAKGWPLLWSRRHSSYRKRVFFVGTVVSLAGLLGTLICYSLADNVPPNSFGPYARKAGALSLWHAVLHSTCVAICVWFCVRRHARGRRSKALLLGMCVLELTIAQGWMLMTTHQAINAKPHANFAFLRPDGHRYPLSFYQQGSREDRGARLDAMVRHDLDTLMPKYHLLTQQRQINSISSLRCRELAEVLQLYWSNTTPSASRHKIGSLLANKSRQQRIWLAYDWEFIDSQEADFVHQVFRTERDLMTRPVVAGSKEVSLADETHRGTSAGERCELLVDRPELIQVAVETNHKCLLVLGDQVYPGWTAYQQAEDSLGELQEVPIQTVNYVMRGIFLRPGQHTITFAYQPATIFWGAIVSLGAWGLLVFGGSLAVFTSYGANLRRRSEP